MPFDTGTVVTYDEHTVTGRNYATGAAVWTYTRTDVSICNVFQESGITIAIFTDRDGFCDEVDALRHRHRRPHVVPHARLERQHDRRRTGGHDGDAVHADDHRRRLHPGRRPGERDRPVDLHRPARLHEHLGRPGQRRGPDRQHCGDGDHLLLRDAYAGDDNDNKAKAIWNVLSDAIPVSADGLISALDPKTGQLLVYSSTDGKVTRTADPRPAAGRRLRRRPSRSAVTLGRRARDDRLDQLRAGHDHRCPAVDARRRRPADHAERRPAGDQRAGNHRDSTPSTGGRSPTYAIPTPPAGSMRLSARHRVRRRRLVDHGVPLSGRDDPATLIGAWTIERTCSIELLGLSGSFTGTAR